MVARVQKTQNTYAIVLTPAMMRELHLEDGSQVEVRLVEEAPKSSPREVRYATAEEVSASFERTLPRHEGTYRELAK